MFQKMPSKRQWGQLLKILNNKERIAFFIFLAFAVFGLSSLSIDFYLDHTKTIPTKGGSFTEGALKSPRFINPVYAATFDSDRDLTELIYAGLMTYNGKGEIVPELAEKYESLEKGRVFEFYLKENLYWSDGEPLTADDVIFTIKTIQNPSIKSPVRANWLGVKVEKISDLVVRFEMSNPSVVFLENSTQEIIPEHIWRDISYQNFPLAIYNFNPVGAGPYRLKDISQDSQGNVRSAELTANAFYVNGPPNIENINFKFFDSENDLIKAFNSGEIQALSLSSLNKYKDLKDENSSKNYISLPRYFSVFFNPEKSKVLTEENIRKALNLATDKNDIVNTVLSGQGKTVDSPILPEIYGFDKPENIYGFDPEKAKEILDQEGFETKEDGFREKTIQKTPAFQFKSDLQVGSRGDEVTELQKCLAKYPDVYPQGTMSGYFGQQTKQAVISFQEKYKSEILTPNGLTSGNGKVLGSTRTKLNELCAPSSEEILPLSFDLFTVSNQELVKVANALKSQWKAIGVKIEIETFDVSTLEQEIIKPRNYEMLLFGEVLGFVPDPFPFWHSTQTKDPGLNLAGYNNQDCDKLLEENRQLLEETGRKDILEEFQNILVKDAPAVFLYSPNYLYLLNNEIKGLDTEIITDSSKRFSNIKNWYIKTKRVWK
ncbi:MAG: ABC transporter substrate-binding protein [Candidatus Nealsonbacteria bacterium]